MNKIKFLYPNGKKKALTLSYDDGVQFDKRLIKILNKYGLKATFNVNSGIASGSGWINNGINIIRMNLEETIDLYRGHEIAVHTLTHPRLENLKKDEITREVLQDKINLQKIFGGVIRGMAYPYGTYNEEVIDVLKRCGIEYSRTVKQQEDFKLPKDFLEWNPTCRHANPRLMELANEFLQKEDGELDLFYLWGHSYEFEVNNNWNIIQEFSELVSKKEDIWYATNIEVYDYINAVKALKFLENENSLVNPTALDIWITIDGNVVKIESGSTFQI